MREFSEENFIKQTPTEAKISKTPDKLKKAASKIIEMFCKDFEVDGLESIQEFKKVNPEAKFVIASSHLSNLDVDGAIKALGDDFDIIVSMESVLADPKKSRYWGHQAIMKYVGKENFLTIKYKEDKKGKRPSFDPDDFSQISEKINEGKTPWIAISPMSFDGTMKQAGVGAVYTAIKNKAFIVPTALEIAGKINPLEGAKELIGGLIKKPEAKYHIGQTISLPEIDIQIIDEVMAKRKNNEIISQEQRQEFSQVVKELKSAADSVAKAISQMLPEDKRGFYK